MRTRQKPKNSIEKKELIKKTVLIFSELERLHKQTIFTPGFYAKYVYKSGLYTYAKCFTACKLTAISASVTLKNWPKFMENYNKLTEDYKPEPKAPEPKQLQMDIEEEKYTISDWAEKFKQMNIEQKDNKVKFTFKEIVKLADLMGIELLQTTTKKITL